MAEGELAEVQAGLDAMQAKFDEAMAEKQRLIDDAAATQARMDAATALITALAGEEVRWTEQSKQFDLQIQRLTGDCAHRLVVRVVPRSVQQGVQGLADATRLLRGFDPARDSGD